MNEFIETVHRRCGIEHETSTPVPDLLKFQISIDALPSELLFLIFTYLPKSNLSVLASVCHRWKNISYNPLLWSGVTVNLSLLNKNRNKNKQLYKVLQERQIKSVNILSCHRGQQLREMLSCLGASIKYLNLSHCPIAHQFIQKAFKDSCGNLTALDMSGHEVRLNSGLLRHLAAFTPNVKQLRLLNTSIMPDDIRDYFIAIANGWRSLEIFQLSTTDYLCVPIESISSLPLKQLTIKGISYVKIISDCVRYFPALEHLHIYGNLHTTLGDWEVTPLAHLRSLVVSGSYAPAKNLVEFISARSSCLLALDLGSMDQFADFCLGILLGNLTRNSPNLEVLILTNCRLWIEHLKCIAIGLKKIRFLEFSVTKALGGLDNELLEDLCNSLKNLELLVINDKDGLCNISDLILVPKYPRLTMLLTSGRDRSKEMLRRVTELNYFKPNHSFFPDTL